MNGLTLLGLWAFGVLLVWAFIRAGSRVDSPTWLT